MNPAEGTREMWVDGCPEEVSPSCRNEKDSGQRLFGETAQAGQEAGEQGEGTAWPPPGGLAHSSCCLKTGLAEWLSPPGEVTAL